MESDLKIWAPKAASQMGMGRSRLSHRTDNRWGKRVPQWGSATWQAKDSFAMPRNYPCVTGDGAK